MSASAAQATIVEALKKLRERFDGVKPVWDDEQRRRFEGDVIEPLEGAVVSAAKAIEQVEELMQRVRRECGDD
jgi:hypothetical protein